jgi:hypothetical protein
MMREIIPIKIIIPIITFNMIIMYKITFSEKNTLNLVLFLIYLVLTMSVNILCVNHIKMQLNAISEKIKGIENKIIV